MTPKDLDIADAILERQITLFRFTAAERAAVLRILKQLEEELVELLFYSGKPLTDIGREDKARLLRQAQKVIERLYGEVSDSMAETMREVGTIEAAALAKSVEVALQGAYEPALPTPAYLKRLADNTLIEGAPSKEWWNRHAGDLAFKFKNAVAQGLAAAETNAQIITRVRGSATGFSMVEGKRVYNYAGGVLQATRANAAALVQTSVAAVANAARRDFFDDNLDVIKGVRQLSTLDSHTTPICVAYSGGAWSLPDRKPIEGTKLPYNGGTPRHWNCRSVEVPITKTFRELGLDIDEFPATTRAATGGPVAANTTFEAFLQRKGPAFTDELLGPGRAQMWRDGTITLQQLLDQSGRPLTLKELRKRYA